MIQKTIYPYVYKTIKLNKLKFLFVWNTRLENNQLNIRIIKGGLTIKYLSTRITINIFMAQTFSCGLFLYIFINIYMYVYIYNMYLLCIYFE